MCSYIKVEFFVKSLKVKYLLAYCSLAGTSIFQTCVQLMPGKVELVNEPVVNDFLKLMFDFYY